MRRLMERLYIFMQGRYGVDKLTYALLGVYMAFVFINVFAQSSIISLLELCLIFYIFFRTLSRNTYKRAAENAAFLRVFGSKIDSVKRKGKELKDTTHVYKKCPKCKSRLRLKRRKGSHTVKCPRCGNEFKIFTFYS